MTTMATFMNLSIALVVWASVLATTATGDQERHEIRRMAQDLRQLYAVQPGAEAAIGRAAGHAVFSNFGMKVLVAGPRSRAGSTRPSICRSSTPRSGGTLARRECSRRPTPRSWPARACT